MTAAELPRRPHSRSTRCDGYMFASPPLPVPLPRQFSGPADDLLFGNRLETARKPGKVRGGVSLELIATLLAAVASSLPRL